MARKVFLPFFIWWFYLLWYSTWRKKLVVDPAVQEAIQNKQPIILAHWHGDELAVLHLVKKFKLATMTSTSKDGELIDYVIRRFGGATTRGSSTRGAVAALKGLVKLVRQGRMASMAVDGPKGPIYQVKPGVFELSRLTNAIIVPVGVATTNPIIFKKSWNKAILPRPFRKVVMTFGQPLPAVTKGEMTKDIKLAEKLREMLFAARQQALKLVAAG